MDHTLVVIFSLILLVLGILGTFLPILPGLILSLGGLIVYKYGTGSDMSLAYVWIFAALTLASAILNYALPAHTNKKYGGTRWGSIGSVAGTIIGLFLPIPFGFLVGMFAGVFVGEMLHDFKDRKKAWNSVKGAFVGFIYGTGFSFVVAVAMFLVVLWDLFHH